MKSINWRAIAEFIGISAIVGSLIFVGLQIRQEQNVAVSQVFQTTLAAEVEIHIAMAEHADILAKARDAHDLSESEKIIIQELVEMWSTRAFFEFVSGARIDGGDWSGPINAFTFFLYDNPGVQQLWSEKLLRKERVYNHFNEGEAYLQFNNRVRQKLADLQEIEN
jgi:hypothetical protein